MSGKTGSYYFYAKKRRIKWKIIFFHFRKGKIKGVNFRQLNFFLFSKPGVKDGVSVTIYESMCMYIYTICARRGRDAVHMMHIYTPYRHMYEACSIIRKGRPWKKGAVSQ